MVAECFNNNIDHPKKNSEFLVIGEDGYRFLEKEAVEKLFDDLDEE